MPTVLIASDKFKGSLTAAQVAAALSAGIGRVSDATVVTVPVADGGDGTVDAAVSAGFERVPRHGRRTHGRAGRDGVCASRRDRGRRDGRRLRALAAPRWPARAAHRDEPWARARSSARPSTPAARRSSSASAAARAPTAAPAWWPPSAPGCSTRTTTTSRTAAPRWPTSTGSTWAPLRSRIEGITVTVASDVDNPLLGERGAAAVYGPQKGASPDQVAQLEAALAHWADLVEEVTGRDDRHHSGAGAAGGVGFGAVAVLGASIRSGIDLLLDLVGFDAALAQLTADDLVVTGEGSLDEQTLHGKAPAGVAAAAAARGIPVVAVCGRTTLDAERLRAAGIHAAYSLTEIEPDPQRCFDEAATLLEQLGERLARERLLTTDGAETGATS